MIQNISRRLSTLKGKPGMPKDPSASFGWSIHTLSQNTSFEEHLKEADDRMYKAKEAYRKSHPLEAGRVFTRENRGGTAVRYRLSAFRRILPARMAPTK